MHVGFLSPTESLRIRCARRVNRTPVPNRKPASCSVLPLTHAHPPHFCTVLRNVLALERFHLRPKRLGLNKKLNRKAHSFHGAPLSECSVRSWPSNWNRGPFLGPDPQFRKHWPRAYRQTCLSSHITHSTN